LSAEQPNGWFGAADRRDLSAFPTGRTDIAGIPFDIPPNACPATPETALPRVDRKLNAFFVMHTLHIPTRAVLARLKRMVMSDMDNDRGLVVGHYRMTYDDGAAAEFPLHVGWNIYSWDGPEVARYGYGSRWTWTGGSPASLAKDPYARDVNVQQVQFLNPHPDRTVSRIHLVSAETGAVPVVLALTLELLRGQEVPGDSSSQPGQGN